MGCCAAGLRYMGVGRDHWSEMLESPRKPVAQWYTLVEMVPGGTHDHTPNGKHNTKVKWTLSETKWSSVGRESSRVVINATHFSRRAPETEGRRQIKKATVTVMTDPTVGWLVLTLAHQPANSGVPFLEEWESRCRGNKLLMNTSRSDDDKSRQKPSWSGGQTIALGASK